MNLKQTIAFSLSILFLLIGVHQTIQHGFAGSYWLFMLMICFLILYQYWKEQDKKQEKNNGSK